MLDRYILGRLRPLMLPLARPLAAAGVGADQVTYAGFGFGLLAAGRGVGIFGGGGGGSAGGGAALASSSSS